MLIKLKTGSRMTKAKAKISLKMVKQPIVKVKIKAKVIKAPKVLTRAKLVALLTKHLNNNAKLSRNAAGHP